LKKIRWRVLMLGAVLFVYCFYSILLASCGYDEEVDTASAAVTDGAIVLPRSQRKTRHAT
jgi:hypothetical protein